MYTKLVRASMALLFLVFAVAAQAGTLEVTAPTDGAFIGRTNTLSFIIRGASQQVTVRAQVTGPGGGVTEVQGQFTPNTEGEITNSLPLNFSASNPEGTYTIFVTATEPNNTYNSVTITVTLDVTSPKFLEFNPLSGAFVKGIVPITVKVQEPNVKEMRIQINGEDIPDNTTTLDEFTVNWDTAGIEEDGPQTITIKVKDEANNESTQTIQVTLDRVNPTITVRFPGPNGTVRAGSTVSVIVDVNDASATSVHAAAVDVIVTRMDGSFLYRVTRLNVAEVGNKLVWSGRVRWRRDLGGQFKIVANAVDKAGNIAATQTVIVRAN